MSIIRILNPARTLYSSRGKVAAFSGKNTEPVPANVENLSSCCYPWPELIETAEEYVLRMAVHGMQKDDFDIDYSASRLTVIARKRVTGQSDVCTHQEELPSGGFSRTFTLPDTIEAQGISAEVDQGVLSIHVPKREAVAARQIKVG